MAESNKPQNVNEDVWYYEMPGHLLMVHQVYDKAGDYISTEQFKVPWRMIEASRKRRLKNNAAVIRKGE